MNKGEKVGMMLLAGNSHPELVTLITEKLGVRLAQCDVYHKSNRETMVEIADSVRGKDVYIIQTGTKNVNNDIMELMVLAYACKTSSSRKITAVMPYLPYCKQSKMRKRGCIVSKLLAKMLGRAGISHFITMDLHAKEIQGFFDIPVDNLRASPFLLQYIQEQIPDYRNAVIVAKNPNAVKRATSYAERLRLGIAVIHGEEKVSDSDADDGRSSPPLPDEESRTKQGMEFFPAAANPGAEHLQAPVPPKSPRAAKAGATTPRSASSKPSAHAAASPLVYSLVLQRKEKPPMNVVGDVGGRKAIIVDDMIDDAESFVHTAELLKERGAYKIYVMATHGLLSTDAPTLLESSPIDEIVVTNTVPHDLQKMQCHKIKTVDISILLVEAIRRIHNNESMSYLFKDISTED